jgi:histidinol dehydrogenase
VRILHWDFLEPAGRTAALARPALATQDEVVHAAQEIIGQVRQRGDAALQALTERFDGARLDCLEVSRSQFQQARSALSAAQIAALERAIANVQRFHEAQVPQPASLETEAGVHCEQIFRAIRSVGLYVPAGSAPLPSAVIMLAIPARIAGCARCVLCTPPRSDGTAHPAILTAAQLCGIDTVFMIGGAQAIAALAYGTGTIPRVDKIFGPGNAWVTAAKRLVAADPVGAACDLPAGPSEVMVLADDSARADFVAADLLAQAEHDVLSQAILVTDSAALAEAVSAQIAIQLPQLSRTQILRRSLESCRALVVAKLDTAVEIANRYAPEHLILQLRNPRRTLARIDNAGAVFLGPWSPETLGDYCSGTNHVLPTYGHARALSGLTLRDFLKSISVQELTAAGLRCLGPTAVNLAALEGLDAHARAVTLRLNALSDQSHEPVTRVAS